MIISLKNRRLDEKRAKKKTPQGSHRETHTFTLSGKDPLSCIPTAQRPPVNGHLIATAYERSENDEHTNTLQYLLQTLFVNINFLF